MNRAFKQQRPVRIVAFGSSSTAGAGASSKNKTYPARLQAALAKRFPEHRFEVVNKGKGGELARHMLVRLERDVIAKKPTLVIWQTGVNDAIRGIDMKAFRALVEVGIERLRQEGIDVVLLDQQYYPKSKKVRNYAAYLKLVRDIGKAHKVPVFRRYQLMSHLVRTAQFKVEELLAPDKFHQNDTSYDCLGTVIADALSLRLRSVH